MWFVLCGLSEFDSRRFYIVVVCVSGSDLPLQYGVVAASGDFKLYGLGVCVSRRNRRIGEGKDLALGCDAVFVQRDGAFVRAVDSQRAVGLILYSNRERNQPFVHAGPCIVDCAESDEVTVARNHIHDACGEVERHGRVVGKPREAEGCLGIIGHERKDGQMSHRGRRGHKGGACHLYAHILLAVDSL